MIYDYVVTLKNEKSRSIDTISILVILISAAAFSWVRISGLSESPIFLVAAILLVCGIIWQLYRRKKQKQVGFSKLMVIAGITWFAMPYLAWIGLAVLLLSLLEKPAKTNLEIGFTTDRIVMNHIIKKKYSWQSFSNILLKDGILTLDFKNNRIFQKATVDEEGDAEESEFNDYCHQQLKKHLPHPVTSP